MKRCIPWILFSLLLATSASAHAGGTNNPVLAPHRGELVALRGDKLVPYEPVAFLKAPFTILYFGAGWCPDCRRFSPALVKAYRQESQGSKRFEVLFLSQDKNEEGMVKYMRTEGISFPALAFEKIPSAGDLKRFYSGHGIPCLTIIDQKGTVVLQSKSDQDAAQLLDQFKELLDKRS